MAFINVNSIKYNPIESGSIRAGKNMLINTDSIEFCEISDVSIEEGKWDIPATFMLLQMKLNERNIGKYATEIFLKNGKSILVVENIEFIYSEIINQ